MSPRRFLAGAGLIAARELGAALDSGVAPIATIALALLSNSIFMNEFFLNGVVDMRGFFELQPLLLAFFLPAYSMRIWAEEKKSRTVELLLTLPVVPAQAIAGKFAALLLLFVGYLLLTLPIPILLCALGEPDVGAIAAGYIGLLGLGAFLLALGGFFSAGSADQIVAFTAAALMGAFLVFLGDARVIAILDGLAPQFAPGSWLSAALSPVPPFQACVSGVLALDGACYFVGFCAMFLWCTALALREGRS